MLNCVIIGNGPMALSAIRTILKAADIFLALVLHDVAEEAGADSLRAVCAQSDIPVLGFTKVNDPTCLEAIAAAEPDYVFNINSFKILGAALLSIPRRGAINFHNGPLPRYGGLNVCSWAILNGESEYGVTWHLMEGRIDRGDILLQQGFEIGPGATTASLILKCLMVGVQSFPALLQGLIDKNLVQAAQDQSVASYFSKGDVPFGGRFPIEAEADEIDRLIRALTFQPMKNTFWAPRMVFGSATFFVPEPVRSAGNGRPGEILDVGRDGIVFSCAGGAVRAPTIRDDNGMLHPAKQYARDIGLNIGAVLT